MREESGGGADADGMAVSSCSIPDEEPRPLETSAPRNRAKLSHYTAQRIQDMLKAIYGALLDWPAVALLRHAVSLHIAQLSACPGCKNAGKPKDRLHDRPEERHTSRFGTPRRPVIQKWLTGMSSNLSMKTMLSSMSAIGRSFGPRRLDERHTCRL